MKIQSLDSDVNAALASMPKLESKESSPEEVAKQVQQHCSKKGLNVVTRVTESGDVIVKRVIIG